MNKETLLLMHAAFVRTRNLLEQRGLAPPGVFDSYDALGVTPVSVHLEKAAHERAVIELATCIDDCNSETGRGKLRTLLGRRRQEVPP